MEKMENISNAEYRSREGISASDLKKMVKSMATWKYAKDHPDESDSPALVFGRAFHKMCLEPYDFQNEYIVSPKFDRRTKDGKEAYAKFMEESNGKEVIDEELYQTILDMKEELYRTPYVKKLIAGEHEKSFFWTDEKTGIKCKCRPDSVGKLGEQHILIDLKTCNNAETSAFIKDAMKFGYDIQAAHYIEGMKAMTGHDYKFVFICQEKTEPYLCNILEADEYFIRSGYELRDELLRTYKKCIELDEYPGYMGFAEDKTYINSLTVPNWMRNSMDSEESEV